MSRLSGSAVLVLLSSLGVVACTPTDFQQPSLTAEPALVPEGAGEPLDPTTAGASADALLDANPKLLEGVDGLERISTEVDESGMAHVRYRQTEGGVPVFGSEALVHLTPQGALFGVTDTLSRDLAVDADPQLDRDGAIALAIASRGSGYDVPEDPEAELVVLRQDGRDRLTWQVRVRLEDDTGLVGIPVLFIDAHDRQLAWSFDDLHTFELDDAEKVTFDNRGSTSSRDAVVGDSSDADLRETHDGVGAALDYLAETQARDSWDGRGSKVYSFGHYGRNYANAFWDGRRLAFGDGDGWSTGYMGVLDIAVHELGHALTDAEARLVYQGESGALNEAASDILAAAVEAWVDGGTSQDTWDIGEDTWREGRALRFMQAPSADGSSRSHYANRYTGSADNGGVHLNSGIANHWFHLLAEGGRHHDSRFRSGIVVNGIGIDAAYDIWYTALTRYMVARTDFDGARAATESACAASGYPESTCDQVSAAWFEVGVGPEPANRTEQSGGGGSSSSGGGSTSSGVCPTGWGEVEGSVSGTGRDQRYPYEGNGGDHQFVLVGPDRADFDLYLYKLDSRGQYQSVASSTSETSTESIDERGTAGQYLVQVRSYSGSGAFTLCYDLP